MGPTMSQQAVALSKAQVLKSETYKSTRSQPQASKSTRGDPNLSLRNPGVPSAQARRSHFLAQKATTEAHPPFRKTKA